MERHHPNICPDCEELADSGARCAHCQSGAPRGRRGAPVPPPVDPEWEAFREMIGREFREVRLATEDGGRALVSVHRQSVEHFAFGAEEEERTIWEVLERADSKRVFSFFWDGFPASSASLYATDLGDLGHLVHEAGDDVEPALHGLVRPGEGIAVWSAFFLDVLCYLLAYPPSEIRNYRPDLIPESAVQQAMRRCQDRQGMAGWVRLYDQTIARMKKPDPPVRSNALLAQLLALGIDGFRDAREPATEELSEADRALILENYFRLTYRG
jgi:hypothetical protein